MEDYKVREVKPYFSREEEKEMLKKIRGDVMPQIKELEDWRKESLNKKIIL